ncbi:hypothetical protein BHE74_00001733 [Ensete ventricosum]|nr:hypothetical protein BHE74_00001733 [Ensete ventricosum]
MNRAQLGRGVGLRHYLAEVQDSGTVWRRCMTRALFDRGAGLGHCLAKVQDSYTVWLRCTTRALFGRARPHGVVEKLDVSKHQSCLIGSPGLGKRGCALLGQSRCRPPVTTQGEHQGISFSKRGKGRLSPYPRVWWVAGMGCPPRDARRDCSIASVLATSSPPSSAKKVIGVYVVAKESARIGSTYVLKFICVSWEEVRSSGEVGCACSGACLGFLLLGVRQGILHKGLVGVGHARGGPSDD